MIGGILVVILIHKIAFLQERYGLCLVHSWFLFEIGSNPIPEDLLDDIGIGTLPFEVPFKFLDFPEVRLPVLSAK